MYGTARAVCRYASEFKKGVRQMEEITVNIGELVTGNSGITNDTRQAVEFTGEKLGEYREYGTDRSGAITDTRGTTQTLYRTAEGGLVVHVHEWSRWVGEPDTEWLYAVTEKSLQPGGAYGRLGAACGFGRPLTLAESIGPRRDAPGPAEVVDVGELIESDRARANRARFIEAMTLDVEAMNDKNIALSLELFEDMTELDRQHAISLFGVNLVGLSWHEDSAVIARLTDAVLGVLDDDYFDALEAGHFDAPD